MKTTQKSDFTRLTREHCDYLDPRFVPGHHASKEDLLSNNAYRDLAKIFVKVSRLQVFRFCTLVKTSAIFLQETKKREIDVLCLVHVSYGSSGQNLPMMGSLVAWN